MRFLIALVVLLAVSTAALAASQPNPTRSEYLVSTGAGFMLSKEEGVSYGMDYDVIKPLPGQIFCVAIFESTDGKGAPLTKDLVVTAGAKAIQLQSPGSRVIKNNRRYLVKLMLYLDAEHTKLLSEHDQQVLFEYPRSMAKELSSQFGVEVR